MFTINGKPMKPGDLEKALMQGVTQSVVAEMRERLGAIRHPESGEFPTVVVEGDTLEDMSFRIEGSSALLEIVRSRLSDEELGTVQFIASDPARPPKAFLSYAFEDRDLAEQIATLLRANGIDVWWAEWEIGAGESIRRKIDEGLGACTHFIVLLTPNSIGRPWVQEEIDAGFVRKVGALSVFIPLRAGLAVSSLPPLLQGMLSPEIDASAPNLKQLINDIHGVSIKPPLGQTPKAAPSTGYSHAASRIAEVFVERSRDGAFMDVQMTIDQIIETTGLTEDDVLDALHELRSMLNISHRRVLVKEALYVEFDAFFREWKPADDARTLAADMVNDDDFPIAPSDIAERYGWPARRLNPAMAYLRQRDLADLMDAVGSGPYITLRITKTPATRRFVKSRS